MKMFLALTVAMTLFVAADAFAASPQDAEAMLQRADALKDDDVGGARRLVEEVLQMPGLPPAQRAKALAERCTLTEDPVQARATANEGLAIARAANDGKDEALLLLCRGNAFADSGELDQALGDFGSARAVAERIGDRGLVASSLAEGGYVRYVRGDLNDGLVDLQKSYDIAKALGLDKNRRTALTNIAHIYADSRIAQYDRAIEYYRQLLAEYESTGAKANIADTNFNIGSTYERKNDLTAALLWYRRALQAEEAVGRPGEIAYVKRSIGVTLSKLGRAGEALPLLDAALRQFVKTGASDNEMQTRQSRGIVLRKLGKFDAAIVDLEASRRYFEANKNIRFLEKSIEELALAYAGGGRWQEAFAMRSAELELQRQLAEKLREEHSSRLRVQFDAEKKEQENRALIRERARALETAARIRRLQLLVLILGAAIIVVLAYLVIRHVRDARRMRVMAMTDELTRLPNRRHFLAETQGALERARAHGEPFSFIAFDIDHFKRINDTWGHAAGDVVLQRVAHACRTALRPGDRIGRVGGEEFAVLLPSRLADAEAVAERLRAAVEALDITDVDPSLRVTISLGVAEWTAADATVETIAGRADEVLYRAKEGGRNRVELAVA